MLESTILHFPNKLEHLTLHSRSLMQSISICTTFGCWNLWLLKLENYPPNCDYPNKGFAHGKLLEMCCCSFPRVRNLEPMLVGGGGGGGGGLHHIYYFWYSLLPYLVLYSISYILTWKQKKPPKTPNPRKKKTKREREREREKDRKVAKLQSSYIMIENI